MRRFLLFVACLLTFARPYHAAAETLTFHLPVADVFASVARYNAFIASLGTRAKGVKLVPGGTTFAGQTCAAFGPVYRLGSVTILTGPGALSSRVVTRRGRDGIAITTAFASAGVSSWVPPATGLETDVPFWTGGPATDGVRFVADGLALGSDAGLLPASANGIIKFRADVTSAPDAQGRYRFLLELFGRTATDDSGLVAFAERRCFTFVDIVPVDLVVLQRLVDAADIDNGVVRTNLTSWVTSIGTAIDQRDMPKAFERLASFTALSISRTPDTIPPADSRRLVTGAFHVRRGLTFSPVSAMCGNETRETGEACDGTDLGGFDCSKVGFATGTLTCKPDCTFDTSACVGMPVCGNGLLESGEECDHGAANSDTAPDACRTSCRRAFCGDRVIDSFEDCEGSNLDGETCQSIGYDGGSLRCDKDFCEFDDERCFDSDD